MIDIFSQSWVSSCYEYTRKFLEGQLLAYKNRQLLKTCIIPMATEEKGSGIKQSLQQIDLEMTLISKEVSENRVRYLTLKNYQDKLSTLFKIRVEETERNFKQETQKFQGEIGRSFKNHTSGVKNLDRKIAEIQDSQQNLLSNLAFIQEKVQDLEVTLG